MLRIYLSLAIIAIALLFAVGSPSVGSIPVQVDETAGLSPDMARFMAADRDVDGAIRFQEFRSVVERGQCDKTEAADQLSFSELDVDADGRLSTAEFGTLDLTAC